MSLIKCGKCLVVQLLKVLELKATCRRTFNNSPNLINWRFLLIKPSQSESGRNYNLISTID